MNKRISTTTALMLSSGLVSLNLKTEWNENREKHAMYFEVIVGTSLQVISRFETPSRTVALSKYRALKVL